MQEISILKKEVDRWKEEVKIQEGKSATSASRLKEEVDAHRVTRENLDATIKHLSDTRSEIDKTRKECTDFMDKLRNDEDDKNRKEKVEKYILFEGFYIHFYSLNTIEFAKNLAYVENNNLYRNPSKNKVPSLS